MRTTKSERLKKLEAELADLEQWLKLGLVPKKDLNKHKEEIAWIQGKIEEEKERLQFLKESGELEDYVAPKRGANRHAFNEMPTFADADPADAATSEHEGSFEAEGESESGEADEETFTPEADEEEGAAEVEYEEPVDDDQDEDKDEESYFSDRNRWRRGGIVDPDADEW